MSITTPHVPAWKKLGLKLKVANEDVPPSEERSARDTSTSKRKQSSVNSLHASSESPVKRVKFSGSDGDTTTVPNILTHDRSIIKQRPQIAEDVATNGRSKSRKAVSFANEDGSSDHESTLKANPVKPDSAGSTASATRPKKEKKPKSQRISSAQSSRPRRTTDALDYLNRHFSNKPEWKFNKNREIWILKHVFNTEDIPTEYNGALTGYLHGLKSTGARERLIKDSYDAINDDDTTNVVRKQDPTSVQYQSRLLNELESDTLYKTVSKDEGFASWLETERRPVIILMSLGQDPSARRINGVLHQRVKKSKARTSRIEIESSSESESSSSDDSDDDSEVDTDGKDETSSSGTSGSESTSSSDSDSESNSDSNDD